MEGGSDPLGTPSLTKLCFLWIMGGMDTTDHNSKRGTRLAYTRTEAARVLGITPITVDRLAKRGLLKPSRATRRPLYSLREIERFLRDTTASQEGVSL